MVHYILPIMCFTSPQVSFSNMHVNLTGGCDVEGNNSKLTWKLSGITSEKIGRNPLSSKSSIPT